MSTTRRRFGTDQKATILKRYLVDKVPISDLCDEYGIKPNQIYAWQKILFDHAADGLPAGRRPRGQQGVRPGGQNRSPGAQAPAEERSHRRADGGERPRKKSQWGTLNGRWVPHDTRDEVVDYVRRWNERTEIPAGQFVGWLGIAPSKFHDWRRPLRQGQRAQRLDSARLVAGGLGEAGDPSLLLRVSAGGLPAAGVHDARPRRGGGQPVERLPRVEGGGPHRPLDQQAIEERHGLPSAAKTP